MTLNPDCPCPRGEQPLGTLYGVNMGRGVVRLSTDPRCRIHNEHRYVGNGESVCDYCGLYGPAAWIHPESRLDGVS